jgi:NDP-sugar pyrophosphorylase family protein
MQVVILAGGKGTRLRPFTHHMPKPMISIKGKPFLQHQLELIKSYLTNEVLLLVGYLRDRIEGYFGDGSKFGLETEYSYEEVPLGTGGALKNAESKIKEEFLLLNGDTYLPIDYRKLVDYFHQSEGKGVITIYDNSQKIAPNNVAICESGLVIGYNKKDPKGMTYVDAGTMVFKKSIVDFIPKAKLCSLEEEIFPKLIEAKQLCSFPTSQRFYDTGSCNGLEAIKEVLR